MIHLFINALAASAGGGLTYIRNVLPRMAANGDLRVTIALSKSLRSEFASLSNVQCLELDIPAARRFWYEQSALPDLIVRQKADILLSTGNFAIRRSPVPQVLLSRNSIYLSADFYRDLRSRREYRVWIDTHIRSILAKRSISWADVTVAPTQAFAKELERWCGKRIVAIHHGFDYEAFTRSQVPLAAEVEDKLKLPPQCIKLLFVSHYNYYRNFETLFRALPLLQALLAPRPLRLLLTCQLRTGENPGAYNPTSAAALIRTLGVENSVVQLGAVPYGQLHRLYRHADAYVTPAYTETFAHPLVEAMASGVPVIASDLDVHREICGDAAVYFPKFSPELLCQLVAQVVLSSDLKKKVVDLGLQRSREFSWNAHVKKILALCEEVSEPSRTLSRSR
jgi:glycosyltransferase involved in cell wall biosynthesis